MKWFRSHIKQGSRLALLALAIQFVLSFGHFHGAVAQAAPAFQTNVISGTDQAPSQKFASDSANDPAQTQPGPKHESDQPNDVCAICAVMALASAALSVSPPVLLLPEAFHYLYLTTDAEFIHLNSCRVAFQSRAPPVS